MTNQLKAKRHKLLDSLSQELRGLRASAVFEVFGHKYRLALLSPREEDWVNEKAGVAKSIFEFAAKVSKPRISAALMEIDGLSVAELFRLPEDMARETRELIEGNELLLGEWRREQILAFVNDDLDSQVISQLDRNYGELEQKRNVALKEIPNLSERTPSSL